MTEICLIMSIVCAGLSAARGNFPSFLGWTNSAVWLWYIWRQEEGGAEWDDFMAFRSWALSHGWRRGLQVDRIDNDGGYSPDNCRIVTCKENNDHRNSPRDAKGRYMRKTA